MNEAKAQTRGPRAVDPELEAELAAIARASDLELAHVEIQGNVLRLILDRPEGTAPEGPEAPEVPGAVAEAADRAAETTEAPAGSAARGAGVSLGDCELVAKHVSALLDVVDYGTSRYVLEVSSPGLDRELYGPRDYARFVGRLARITFADEEGRKKTVVGRLRGFAAERGIVTVDAEGREELAIALDRIRKARLEIEL